MKENIIKYINKQPENTIYPKLPMRGILLAPSNSGKTYLLIKMILEYYKNCFERIYIFSQSINLDNQWEIIKKKYPEKNNEKLYFDDYKDDYLNEIIKTQEKVIEYQNKHDDKTRFNILIIIDDFADDPKVSRNSKQLHGLFTRGRHQFISSIVSTQKFYALAPIIRLNVSFLIIFKLKNKKDLDAVIEETSALLNKNQLIKIYNDCTNEKYNFLYINYANELANMFFHNFNQYVLDFIK